jgi:hypothetical protein
MHQGTLPVLAGRLAELVKKSTWHGKVVMPDQWLDAIQAYLCQVAMDAADIGETIQSLLTKNIAKLS